jgi:hypothetical protein
MKEWIMVLKAADAAARWHVYQRRKARREITIDVIREQIAVDPSFLIR